MSGAYYNENDAFAAAWLRELIRAGFIAPGEVDERSIEEVKADDLRGFTQCHFFAGIGVWSYALRLAGWPDSRPIWTGSCPCPSFSAAGQGKGFEDPRHLWPRWFGLIRESRPATIFGEQADKAIGFGWLDLVQTDLEAEGYAVGATVFGAHSVGAPHIRQRLYFVADSMPTGRAEGRAIAGNGSSTRRGFLGECGNAAIDRSGTLDGQSRQSGEPQEPVRGSSVSLNGSNSAGGRHDRRRSGIARFDDEATERSGRELKPERHGQTISGAEPLYAERWPINEHGEDGRDWPNSGRAEAYSVAGTHGEVFDGLNAEQPGLEGLSGHVRDWRGSGWLDPHTARSVAEAGATRGFWFDCDWWYGRDGKYRPIGAGLFPLVAGATGRMGKLRGYGNAICAPQAQAFIEAYMSLSVGGDL